MNLEHALFDLAYIVGSEIADIGSTYIGVKRYGTSVEANVEVGEGMEKEGVGRYLLKHELRFLASAGILAGTLYGVDHILGIEDNLLNLHHAVVYSIPTLGYLAAISNILGIYGHYKIGKIIHLPVQLYMNITNKIDRRDVFR